MFGSLFFFVLGAISALVLLYQVVIKILSEAEIKVAADYAKLLQSGEEERRVLNEKRELRQLNPPNPKVNEKQTLPFL